MVPWTKNFIDGPVEIIEETFQKEGKDKKISKCISEKSQNDFESKEPLSLALGTYKGAIIPVSVLLFGFTCGAFAVSSLKPDPRVHHWFLMDNSFTCLALCIFYILFSIVWGPNFMKHRKPFKLRGIMMLYNVFQVILSAYIFFEVGNSGWFFDYSYRCQPCDYSQAPMALRMTSVGWLFFFSKIIDFLDTLFFVLNKKWSHISMLHTVHHSCMCMSMWYGIAYMPGGHITFMGFLNSGVHVIMYTYYFLSLFGESLRPFLWWKKYLTTVQLVQFIAIFIHAAQLLFIDCPSVPIGLAIWTCIYAFIFFALFIDFYNSSYVRPTARLKKFPNASKPNSMPKRLDDGVGAFEKQSTDMNRATSSPKANRVRAPSPLNFRLDTCLRKSQNHH